MTFSSPFPLTVFLHAPRWERRHLRIARAEGRSGFRGYVLSAQGIFVRKGIDTPREQHRHRSSNDVDWRGPAKEALQHHGIRARQIHGLAVPRDPFTSEPFCNAVRGKIVLRAFAKGPFSCPSFKLTFGFEPYIMDASKNCC